MHVLLVTSMERARAGTESLFAILSMRCGMLVQFGDEDAESMTSRPPPLYKQRRFWALAIPCAFTLGMLIFAIEHLIRDPNEVC